MSRLRVVFRSLLVAACLAWFAGSAGEAHAGMALGLDLNGSKMLGTAGEGLKTGFGANLRLGYALPIPLIDIQPGILLRYNKWPGDTVGDVTDLDGMVGGRVALGALITPFAQLYMGYGRIKTDAGSETGPSILLGAGLDIGLPVISVGVHVDYNRVKITDEKDPTHWMSVGVDGTLSF